MSRSLRTLVVATSLALAPLVAASAGCGASASQSQGTREFDAVGVVREIDAAHLRITIQHEDVPGYMPAMTMPFELASASQADGLAVGAQVRFRFRAAGGGRHVVVTIAPR